jgi:TonB-linked SusC/RagA family outer membrane protein
MKRGLLLIHLLCKKNTKEIFQIMKISIFLLFVCVFQLFALNSEAQNATINLPSSDLTVGALIHEIEQQTDYLVVFSNSEVDIDTSIHLDRKSGKVSDCLKEAFVDRLSYEFENNYIILSKKAIIQSSQQITHKITGKVTDTNGEAVIGANVVEKGTTNGTVTDFDGIYSLDVSPSAVLHFSYVGYNPQEVTVGNKTTIDIRLAENNQVLNEVVVIGYGTQRKGELTSAISSVKSESFLQGSVQDAAQLLQGKVAGLGIALNSGDPTATTQITLRGIGTLLSGDGPLVLVDGVPGSLTTVAPEDIESIDVVKDGSAAAIYGTRGNNGVVFITTKKVRGETPLTIDVHAYMTTESIKKRLGMMDAAQYRELVAQGQPSAVDYGYDTDWLDEIMRTPLSYVTNVSLKGGTNKSTYIANVNYRSRQGIIKRSQNDVLTTRLEVNHNMWDNLLKINVNLIGREQYNHTFAYNSTFRDEIYRNALAYNPTDRPRDDEGNWVERPFMYEYNNPLAMIYESDGKNKSTELRTFGSVTLTPIQSVQIKALSSHSKYHKTLGYSETRKHISTIRDNRNGYASKGSEFAQENLLEITTQYKKSFGKHDLTGLAGYSYQKNIWENDRMENRDFPSDQYSWNNMGAGSALKRGEAEMWSYKSENVLIGAFARINYSYDARYMASASIRHEGSSKFGADNKWGNFPAFSAGWNIVNEEFMRDYNFLSNLKVRVGFGITGTVPTNPYESLSRLAIGDNFLANGVYTPTLKQASNANPDLRWEKKEEWNFGLDFGFLKERISGTIDVYKRTTKDLLWKYDVPMPPYLYSEMFANAGTIENKGLEIGLSIVPVLTNGFCWLTTVNYSTNKNKLVSLSNDKFQVESGYVEDGYLGSTIKQYTHRIYEGGKLGNFYGFKTIDIDEDGRWIIQGKDGEPKPIGDQQPDDKTAIGNGLPKHFLSWNNSLEYKSFDLNITMRGAFGYDILNFPRLNYDCPVSLAHGNVLSTAFDNRFGKRPLSNLQELQYVSYFIENGGFWKIDNITLGYNIKLNNKYLQRIRIYASGSNLITITGYSGIDPEVNFLGLQPGIDYRSRYPSTRTYTFGAMFTF